RRAMSVDGSTAQIPLWDRPSRGLAIQAFDVGPTRGRELLKRAGMGDWTIPANRHFLCPGGAPCPPTGGDDAHDNCDCRHHSLRPHLLLRVPCWLLERPRERRAAGVNRPVNNGCSRSFWSLDVSGEKS